MWQPSREFNIVAALGWLALVIFSAQVFAQTSGTLGSGESFDVSQAFGPGDVKTGYDQKDYQTQSRSLLSRRGIKQDLLQIVNTPPLGLPPVPTPADNPITRAKIDLGRQLFFDRRLSINNTVSCANCHIPEQGFTNNEISTAVGVEGRLVIRNAPTLYNVAYLKHIFVDGREISLENQVWQPITARNEMAAPSIGYVINKIKRIRDYDGRFEAAFDGRSADIATIGDALASYQRTLLAADSPFDRWYYGKTAAAISESAKRGFEVFVGKGQCAVCHRINQDHALFLDHQFHNTGIGYAVSTGKTVSQVKKKTRVQLAPGIFVDMDNETIQSVSRIDSFNDLGLYRITENPADRWKFRTPTLRNVALTAPYMHNGQLPTLSDVIDFYDQGGVSNELLSPFIRPLNLTQAEKADLLAFLESLTGHNVPAIVADAFAAQIGELGLEDPNWAHDNTLGF